MNMVLQMQKSIVYISAFFLAFVYLLLFNLSLLHTYNSNK